MIVTSDVENDVKQAESAPQFTAESPQLNPLVAASPIAIIKEGGGVSLRFLDDQNRSALVRGSGSIVDLMTARSEREVTRRPKSARAHNNLGTAFLNAGDINSAASQFEKALAIDPTHYVAALNLARARIEQGRFEEAEQIYLRVKEKYPNDPSPVVSLAYMAIRKEQYEFAARLLRDAIELGHKAITAKHLLGLIFLKLGKNREAISTLRLATHLEVRAPALYEALGAAYSIEGDFRRAAVAFKTCLSLKPLARYATHGLANAMLELKQTVEATTLLVSYLERNPEDHEAKQLLARAYAGRRQFRSAIAQLTQVWSSVDETPATIALRATLANNIGAYYLDNGETPEGEHWFLKSIAIGPMVTPIPYNNLARAALRNGMPDEAFEFLQTSKKRFGDNPDTVFMLALCFNRVGLYDEGIAQMQPLVDSGKATPEGYSLLSSLFSEGKGDYQTGLQIAKEAFKKFRDHDGVANLLAYQYLLSGDANSARPILEAYQERDEEQWTHPSYRITMTATEGLLRIVEGDFKEGARFYRKAEKLCSQLGYKETADAVVQKMHLELARAYVRNRNFESAKQHIREGLAVRGGYIAYEQHLQGLQKQLTGNGSATK
jgi:tetratricopeptide (TPR) repeat protein